MSLDDFLDQHGIEHFQAAEVAPREQPPETLWPKIIPTLLVLEWLRHRLGCPLYVTSGYRSPEHNAAVGGAKRSEHMDFAAVDFHAGGKHTPIELANALEQHPMHDALGLGAYIHDGHCHVDVRGYRARWSVPAGAWP